MAWYKHDDRFLDDPRHVALGDLADVYPLALALWLGIVTHVAREESDGRISRMTALRRVSYLSEASARKALDALLKVGLLASIESDPATLMVVGWLETQHSREHGYDVPAVSHDFDAMPDWLRRRRDLSGDTKVLWAFLYASSVRAWRPGDAYRRGVVVTKLEMAEEIGRSLDVVDRCLRTLQRHALVTVEHECGWPSRWRAQAPSGEAGAVAR